MLDYTFVFRVQEVILSEFFRRVLMATRGEMIEGLAEIFDMNTNSVDVVDRTMLDLGFRSKAKRGRAVHHMGALDVAVTSLALTMSLGIKPTAKAIDCLFHAKHLHEDGINFPLAFAAGLDRIASGHHERIFISFSQLESAAEIVVGFGDKHVIHNFRGGDPDKCDFPITRITVFDTFIQKISGLVTPGQCPELDRVWKTIGDVPDEKKGDLRPLVFSGDRAIPSL